jgi:hypothetical protein
MFRTIFKFTIEILPSGGTPIELLGVTSVYTSLLLNEVYLNNDQIQFLHDKLPGITWISCCGVIFESPTGFRHLLQTFNSIRELELDGGEFGDCGDLVLPKMKRLLATDVLPMGLRNVTFGKLHALDIWSGSQDPELITHILKRHPRITDLSLPLDPLRWGGIGEAISHLPIAYLGFSPTRYPGQVSDIIPLDVFREVILSCYPLKHLVTVDISLCFKDHEDMEVEEANDLIAEINRHVNHLTSLHTRVTSLLLEKILTPDLVRYLHSFLK